MAEFDLNNIKNYFESKGCDLTDMRKKSGKSKNVDDKSVSAFDSDNGIINKEDFIEELRATKNNPLSVEQLGLLYDAIASFDGEDGMSQEELEWLASLGNETDVNDPNGKKINEEDIEVLLDSLMLDEVEEETDLPEAVFKNDDRIIEDSEGNRSVYVEKWVAGGNKSQMDCLEHIIANCYDLDAMGIKYGSEEYYELEKAVMDANPWIYEVDENGKLIRNDRIVWHKPDEDCSKKRHCAILFTGDKILLPDFKPKEPDAEYCPDDEDDTEYCDDNTTPEPSPPVPPTEETKPTEPPPPPPPPSPDR